MRVQKNQLFDVVPYTIVNHVDLALRIGSDIFARITVAMWNRCKQGQGRSCGVGYADFYQLSDSCRLAIQP